jgi:hypothetical protein
LKFNINKDLELVRVLIIVKGGILINVEILDEE